MSNSDHKVHNLLPKNVHEIRKKDTRMNNQMYYNFIGKTERFKSSQLAMPLTNITKHYQGSGWILTRIFTY